MDLENMNLSIQEAPPPCQPRAETAKPSPEAMKPSSETLKPSSETLEPSPDYGDRLFLSKPRPNRANPIYGDSNVLSKPGLQVRSLVLNLRTLVCALRDPIATRHFEGFSRALSELY